MAGIVEILWLVAGTTVTFTLVAAIAYWTASEAAEPATPSRPETAARALDEPLDRS